MIMARVWRNERYSGREKEREERERKRERQKERVPEPDGKAGREEDRATNVKERNTKRRRKRREWAHGEKEKRGGGKEVEKGCGTRYTEREESGPFDGAFVGSRGALRFATKIVALPARARRSALRRVICCEFINATIARRSNAHRFVPSLGRAGDSAHRTRAYSIELLNFQVGRGVVFLLIEL